MLPGPVGPGPILEQQHINTAEDHWTTSGKVVLRRVLPGARLRAPFSYFFHTPTLIRK